MPVNVSPEYVQAEKAFLEAQTDEDRLFSLEEMMKVMPGHKGAESLRANLRTRYKKLKEKIETRKKTGKGSSKEGIKKDDMQVCIVGLPNVGKSSLFKVLTDSKTVVSPVAFSTYEPVLGTINYEDVKIQAVDMPPFPNEDKSVINTTDTILIVVNEISQIEESEKFLQRTRAKKMLIFTKSDLMNSSEKRKILATLNSKFKKYSPIVFSSGGYTKEDLESLKKKIFQTFQIIRVYTKEPKKDASKIPMILKKESTLSDVAEKILKGMSKKIKRTRIWGPSSKFPGQAIGLEHKLKDKDIVEFQTI